jgi:acyl carrier protein
MDLAQLATLANGFLADRGETAPVGPDADLLVDADLDSLGFIELAMFLEERTGRTIPFREAPLARLRTLAGLHAVLFGAP